MGYFESIGWDPVFHLYVLIQIIQPRLILWETERLWHLLRIHVSNTAATISCELSEIFEFIRASQKLQKSLVVKLVVLSLKESGTFALSAQDNLV